MKEVGLMINDTTDLALITALVTAIPVKQEN